MVYFRIICSSKFLHFALICLRKSSCVELLHRTCSLVHFVYSTPHWQKSSRHHFKKRLLKTESFFVIIINFYTAHRSFASDLACLYFDLHFVRTGSQFLLRSNVHFVTFSQLKTEFCVLPLVKQEIWFTFGLFAVQSSCTSL